MGSWVDAVDNDDLDMFKSAVTEDNINTYVTMGDDGKATGVLGDEYTPVLYLARKSPPKNFKGMLSHCLDLDADLSLKANTIDCRRMGLTRCTTIGNLASWRESKIWNEDPMGVYGVYDILVKMNRGEPNLFDSNIANTNAMKWKKTTILPCLTWKAGCGIPGISVTSSLGRTARFAGKVVAGAPVAAAGAVAGTGLAAGTLASVALSKLTKSTAKMPKFWGGRKSSRKSKSRSRSRKSRKSRR